MKQNQDLCQEVDSLENLFLAFKKHEKEKQKNYVIEFIENIHDNLFSLHEELLNREFID